MSIRSILGKRKQEPLRVDLRPELRDFTERDFGIIEKVLPFTMTSPERIKAVIDAIDYIHKNGIQGSIVECGVWKGGSVMAAMLTLIEHGDVDRMIYLFDTFEGMNSPTENDRDINGALAQDRLKREDKKSSWVWALSTLQETKLNVLSTGYKSEKINFIKGEVEKTLIENTPDDISLLRLDTDWYESTKIELEYLYPKVVKGGIIIIDDYGHWEGAKKAVDEFIAIQASSVYLHRIDYTGRLFIKQ